MHKFRIELTGPMRGKVWIDDIEMLGVKSIRFSVAHDQMCEVTLTLGASEVKASGQIETTCLSDDVRTYRAGMHAAKVDA